ncbi:MaoC/PaaZ C-terminal domain-containing protein [Roseomonas chloroacetimidivorans]|uniref:MaoC family dehydratase n=1 Tax=Roseomonas chloroacetimidivorans TaxID=1766656 RepID=UPI003C782469
MNPDAVMARRFEDVPVRVEERDAILYALGIGLGDEPESPAQLRYTYEKDLAVFPTMPVVLGSPGLWFRDPALGIDAPRIVHAEQSVRNHRPIHLGEPLVARNAITDLVDKGEGKGALLTVQRELLDEGGAPVATVRSTYFLRGDGGFGGPRGESARPEPLPDRAPDITLNLSTLPQAALIYRLSGDRNPLHADPDFARRAGQPRPILHGLCTFAVAARGLLRARGGEDAARMGFLSARMSAPVFPGETVRLRAWDLGGSRLGFEASVPSREVVVLSQGRAEVEPG